MVYLRVFWSLKLALRAFQVLERPAEAKTVVLPSLRKPTVKWVDRLMAMVTWDAVALSKDVAELLGSGALKNTKTPLRYTENSPNALKYTI